MVCESCGEKPKNTAKDFTKAVIEINNPEALVLLRKVVIPTSMGDEESVPPAIGKYRNVLLQYEANDHIYLYSSDGIPTAITANIPQEILDSIAELEATDVVLQQEIDDLKNSPDVVDIVPTYADLQDYDTSKLGDNDIIRVLQDEQHDGQSTYYRWNATTSSWTYIGAVGDYYTKGQVDTLLAGKQNTLTAGANVQISPENVISATDTTYTHFTGATASTDGTAGLVPAPVAGDDTKFLSGDGTWGTPAGATYTAGANVQISAQNVISATDTTYSAFTGTDGQTAGTAGLVPAPATTDAGKFLKADGTWDTAGGGGGDTVYSDKTTSNTTDGGAVYIGPLNASQVELSDPTTTDNHYRYFWALPFDTTGQDNFGIPQDESINIGGKNTASHSVSVGYRCRAMDSNSVVLGWQSTSSGFGNNVVIGNTAISLNSNAIAIGRQAETGANGSAAIGAYARTTRAGEVNIGSTSSSYGYNSTNYRVLGGVHDGQDAHDAATVGQLTAYSVLSGAGAPTTSTAAQYVGQFYYDTTNDGYYYCTAITAQGTTPETYSYTWTALSTGGGSGPTVVQTTGTSQTDVMSQNAVTSMVFADPATATRVSIGNANAGTSAVSIGQSTYGAGEYSTAVGYQSNTYGGSGAVAIGQSARARASKAIAIGHNANNGQDGGASSVAIGSNSHAGEESVTIGENAGDYTQNNTVSLGRGARAWGRGSVAIGDQTQMDLTNSVRGTVSIKSTSVNYGYNGTSQYRLLTGVYDAQSDNDAVNLGQLNGRVKQNAGAPTTATVGTVGQLLEDTTNGKLYICTDATNPYVWEEVGAGGGGTTEIEYVNCTLTGATATGFTLSADKTATQVKALVESGKEVIYKFVNPTTAGSILAGTYEFSVLFAGTNSSVDVVTGYGMTEVSGTSTQGVYTFNHISSTVTVTAGAIPTVNDATLTIQKNGTGVATFTANASSNATANIEVPTITMTTTDPGEGSALAADNFVAVYGGDPIIMDYSTSEINTGATWINGAPIYKKTISTGTLPNATTKNVAHGISNLGLVIDIKGCAWDGSSTWLPIPNAGSSSATIEAYVYSSNIVITTGMDRTGFTTSYVTLYYTKSS